MRKLFALLIFVLAVNPIAQAQTTERPVTSVGAGLRKLIQGKKDEIAAERRQLEVLSGELVTLQKAIEDQRGKSNVGFAIGATGIVTDFVALAALSTVSERNEKLVLLASLAGFVAFAAGAGKAIVHVKKAERLREQIKIVEDAIKKYELALGKDEDQLDALERDLAIHINE